MTVQELIVILENLPTDYRNHPVFVYVWEDDVWVKKYLSGAEVNSGQIGVELCCES